MKLKEVKLWAPEGFVPAFIPANAPQDLENRIIADAFNAMLIRRTAGTKSVAMHAERFEMMLWAEEGISAAEIRRITKDKREKRNFRRYIASIKAHNSQPLIKDALQRFILHNWQVLVMVNHPKYKDLPGLRRWRPRAALNLAKVLGYGIQPGHYYGRWYKDTRTKLGLTPQLPYLITALPK